MSKIIGRGRHEPNKPRVLPSTLYSQVYTVCKDLGVKFPDSNRVFSQDCVELYRRLMYLAPALAIAADEDLTIKGLFSFKVKRTKAGKMRLRVTTSRRVSKYLDTDFDPDKPSYRVLMDLLRIGKSKDSSVEVATHEY